MLGLIWFLAHEIYTVIDGITSQTPKADCIVVLGTKVNEDGSLSDRLVARLDRALELYQNRKSNQIFVSGGLGKEGQYEGSKMAQYLTKNGIPKSAIIIDNQGNTTRLTAMNLSEVIPTTSSVIVVSQFYHLTRCKLALRQVGYQDISSAHAEYLEWRDLYGLFREFFGFYKYLIWY